MRRFGGWGVLAASLLLGGCVKQPQVQVDELPVKRVVVYRNGVAYFERNGRVEGEDVHFRLRRENVGDFLATLAILERGGSTVRTASFPVEFEEEEEEKDPAFDSALDAWEGKKPEKRPGLRTVTLELDGEEHDLTVGYLAETPVWKPSYRLVVGENGTAELQAWGIVQNQSGEDWKDVQISLVAGAPIAFESTLGDPVIPGRPVVTDSGEVITAVPESGTTYHQEGAPPAPPAEAAREEAQKADGYGYEFSADALAESDDEAFGASGGRLGGSHSAPASRAVKPSAPKKSASGPGNAPVPASAPAPVAPSFGGVGNVRDSSRLASVAAQTGSTRYDVPHTITIPDQSATMVLLVSKTIPGEAVHLFAPDPAVPDSSTHPFRVVRFRNESGGLLEKGPIAVFEKGAFLSQGVMESLPLRGAATVPFALVRGLAVQTETRFDQRGARLYSIENGNLQLEQDYAQITIYHAQNGEKDAVRLVVRHPRNMQAKLFQPPAGTDEDLGAGYAYVPVNVPSYGKGDLSVEERYPIQQNASFRSIEARRAIEEFLNAGGVEPELATKLRNLLTIAKSLSDADDIVARLHREQAELEKSSRETRLSIEAIEKNPKAGALRAELTERLRKTTARLDEITKELIEVGLRQGEQEVRLREATQGITVLPPDQRKR